MSNARRGAFATESNAQSSRMCVVMPLGERRGGGEEMLRQLVQHSRADIEWTVLFLEPGPMVKELCSLGVRVEIIEAGRLRQTARYVQTVREILRVLREIRPALVVGWMTKAHLYSGPAAFLAGVPSVWYQLGVPTRHAWMDRVATALPARAVLTLSTAAARSQQRLRPRRIVHRIFPGVDLDEFDPNRLPSKSQCRDRLDLPSDVPIVGIVGRLQRWKGMHTLIEAMPSILREHPQVLCVIVGGEHPLERNYHGFLQQLIVRLKIQDTVRLVGHRTEVALWMNAFDVVVHASDNEPFGIVVLEAMALGKPVVAGARGGPAEIITPGVDGFLTPVENPGDLAQIVTALLSDRQLASQLGTAARRRARDFSSKAYADRLVATLRAAAR